MEGDRQTHTPPGWFEFGNGKGKTGATANGRKLGLVAFTGDLANLVSIRPWHRKAALAGWPRVEWSMVEAWRVDGGV